MFLLLLAMLQQQGPQFYNERGSQAFKEGRIEDSIRDFDKAIQLEPRYAPHHWQRGISLYYAGRYKDCRSQFDLHKSVNPEDVENAVWHYLCAAKLDGVESARKRLIPIKSDGRMPMMEVYAMYRGESTADKVMEQARSGTPSPGELNVRLFYANLYVGLFLEAAGKHADAMKHIRAAVDNHPVDHYMWEVARVHLQKSR